MNTALILSKDTEFAQTLAEQLRQEKGLVCKVVATATLEELQGGKGINILISNDKVDSCLPFPVLVFPTSRKPYRLQDILTQVDTALSTASEEEHVLGGGLLLRLREKQLMHSASGAQASLTDKEVQLLLQLIQAGKEGLAREELLKRVWGIEASLDTHTLETHIYRLRGKLRELVAWDMIEAIEGGYALANHE